MIIGIILIGLGCYFVFEGFIGLQAAETSIHALYYELEFVIAAILIGSGSIVMALDGIKDKIKKLENPENSIKSEEE